MTWFGTVQSRLPCAAQICAALCASWLTLAHAQDAPYELTADDQFRYALYLRETGRPYSAIETLESLLAAHPSLNRARLELAVAYYRTLNFARAQAEAQRVLNDRSTPANVRLSVLSFIKQIELEESTRAAQTHRFEPTVSLGLFHDSNANAGPSDVVLPGDLVLSPNGLKQSDSGRVAQAGITHTWVGSDPIRLNEAAARLNWTSQASIYRKAHATLSDYNLTVLSLSTAPGLQFNDGERANLNVQLDRLSLGGSVLAHYTSLSPSYTWRMLNGAEISLDGQWVRRQFDRAEDADRNSHYHALTLAYARRAWHNQLALQLGGSVFRESARSAADSERFSNRGQDLFAGLRYSAWSGGALYTRASWRRTQYRGLEPVYGAARRETERRVELGISHRFADGWLDHWQLAGTVTFIDNAANLSLYDYQRSISTVTLDRAW